MYIQYISTLYCIFLIILLLSELLNIHLEAGCFIFRLISMKNAWNVLFTHLKIKVGINNLPYLWVYLVSRVIFFETFFCTYTWYSTWNNEAFVQNITYVNTIIPINMPKILSTLSTTGCIVQACISDSCLRIRITILIIKMH